MTVPPNPQRKLPRHATRPADRTCKAGTWYLDQARRGDRMRASWLPARPCRPRRLQPSKRGSLAEPPFPRRHSAAPPAPIKASQLPIIRLAASLRDSLSSDNGSPPIAS
jgi:hypothetical protein